MVARVADMTALRERFEKKGYSVSKYANRVNNNYPYINVGHADISQVLSGKGKGVQCKRNGMLSNYQAIIETLKKDGVWIDELPWKMKRSS